MSNCSESRVLEFYRGSTVLLAGGTGFLGKTLLEKILRCLNVEVDYSAKDFGLAPELTCEIRKEVEIVLYCIATVKLMGALKETVETNVFLARRMLQWCRTFPRLQAFVYTSTFCCNLDQAIIEEKVYTELPFGSYEIVMNMLKHLSAEECEQLKSTILQKIPNTYIFSKRVAEIMIETEFAQTLPVAIYRPPIITPTCREPMLGWTDNPYGTAACIKSFWDGLGHVIYVNSRAECSFAPVDYCANAVLVSGFDLAEKRLVGSAPCVPVYNHHRNTSNTTYGELMRWIGNSRKDFWERIRWKYYWISTSFVWLMYLNVILARIKDFIAMFCKGSKPSNKFYYRWSAYWLKRAQCYLSEREQQIFFTDLDEINWREYMRGHVDGAIQYLESENKRRYKN